MDDLLVAKFEFATAWDSGLKRVVVTAFDASGAERRWHFDPEVFAGFGQSAAAYVPSEPV